MRLLAINEEFYSIQGEGLHTGIPMYFVRLQGCDVGCYFCDTKYTWRDKKADTPEWDIINRALESGVRWICITGGEPYEQDLRYLIAIAHIKKLSVHIETSGGADFQHDSPNPDWMCLSPKDLFTKKEFECREEFKKYSNEIKCVVTKESDVDFYIKEYYPYCNQSKPMIFQLVDNDVKLIEMILKKINENKLTNARIMMQVHKIMEMR